MKVNLDVPEWAHYMAQNPTGYWYFFEAKPVCIKNSWIMNDYSFKRAVAYRDAPPKDYELTLYKLERNG